MTDISVFKKLLEPPSFTPLPRSRVWLCAYRSKILPSRFQYHLWIGKYSPLYEFSTLNVEHARAAAKFLGETVIEHGPPEAFGRVPK
ncbi:MAG: hypothetical protein WA832_03520 [Bradyrhizobium sp.]|uniref:hypothetical protein n=1 Tax=Bradyrhizobium sp. TaxID=376 RepID=UPI003BE45B3D